MAMAAATMTHCANFAKLLLLHTHREALMVSIAILTNLEHSHPNMYIKRQGQKGRHSTYVRSYSLDRFNKIDRNRWRCATSALYRRLANRRSFQNVKKSLWAALILEDVSRSKDGGT